MALGHLDELQRAEKYPIRWSLSTGFTVYFNRGADGATEKNISKWHKNDITSLMHICNQAPMSYVSDTAGEIDLASYRIKQVYLTKFLRLRLWMSLLFRNRACGSVVTLSRSFGLDPGVLHIACVSHNRHMGVPSDEIILTSFAINNILYHISLNLLIIKTFWLAREYMIIVIDGPKTRKGF